jgi:hypothetical protein
VPVTQTLEDRSKERVVAFIVRSRENAHEVRFVVARLPHAEREAIASGCVLKRKQRIARCDELNKVIHSA